MTVKALVGQTRFSLYNPGSVAWRASNGSTFENEEDYRKCLFDPRRLEPRLRIFRRLSVPLLSVQAEEYNLHHIVSFSSLLPTDIVQALEETASENSFLVLDEVEPDMGSLNPHTYISELYEEQDVAYSVFRLDDDDLVPVNYLARLSRFTERAFAPAMVSFGQGFSGLYEGKTIENIRSVYRPKLAIGLASVCFKDEEGKVLQPETTSHLDSDRKNPLILDSREPGFFWMRHLEQDTSVGVNRENARHRILEDMGQYPKAESFHEVKTYFPTLRAFLPEVKEERLLEQSVTLASPRNLNFNDSARRFSVWFNFENTRAVRGPFCLISFDIRDSVSNRTLREFDGFHLSSRKDIGVFRYFASDRQSGRLRFDVDLGEGFSCCSIKFMQWGDPSNQVKISNVDIQYGGIND